MSVLDKIRKYLNPNTTTGKEIIAIIISAVGAVSGFGFLFQPLYEGAIGLTGATGEQGAVGDKGTVGDNGTNGLPGDNGLNGTSFVIDRYSYGVYINDSTPFYPNWAFYNVSLTWSAFGTYFLETPYKFNLTQNHVYNFVVILRLTNASTEEMIRVQILDTLTNVIVPTLPNHDPWEEEYEIFTLSVTACASDLTADRPYFGIAPGSIHQAVSDVRVEYVEVRILDMGVFQ